MSERSLSSRYAIVTGGNSGIGLAIAKALAAAGAGVAIAGRRAEMNKAAVSAIQTAGGNAMAVTCDAASETDASMLVDRVTSTFGGLNICVACAGGIVGGSAPLPEMTTRMWRDTLAVNIDAVFYLYREAARCMIAASRGGSFISISSVSAIRATPSLHYAAAKGAVNAMTINLAAQLAVHRIRVNAILPGMIGTPPLQAFLANERHRSAALKRIPAGRIGVPDDIAGMAVYLAGEQSSYVTGQQFVIDGGMVGS